MSVIPPEVGYRIQDLERVFGLQEDDYFEIARLGSTTGLPNKRIGFSDLKQALGIGTWEGLTGNPMGNTAFAAIIDPIEEDIARLFQSIHRPATINQLSANGLLIDGNQVLSMALAGGSQAGALSASDWNLFSGKVGTGANIGDAGEGLFAGLNGTTMQFKRLIAGTNVTLTPTADGITINSTGGSGTGITQAEARQAISETIAGIDYDSIAGVFSLSAGHVIPTQQQLDSKLNRLAVSPNRAGTWTKLVVNAEGQVTAGDGLAVADIPQLSIGKIDGLSGALNTKLGTGLTAAHILVGSAANVATGVALSGDATITAAGQLSLKDAGSAGSYFRVTTDTKGRVTGGLTALAAEHIPTLPVTKLGTNEAVEGHVLTNRNGIPTWAAPTGAGEGEQSDGRRLFERFLQPNIGADNNLLLANGNVVRFEPNVGWVKAWAENEFAAARAIGIITDSTPDYVEVTYWGYVDTAGYGLADNSRWYLPTTAALAGVLQTTPTATGAIRKEMLLTLTGNRAFFRPGEVVVVGSGSGGVSFTADRSLQLSGSSLTLDGDLDTPGNNMVYGTGSTGVKGWYAAGAGGTSLTGGMSLALLNGVLTLDNDAESPGNNRYYGTNGSGVKGYHLLPTGTGGVTGSFVLLNDVSQGDAAVTGTFSAGQLIAENTLSIRGVGMAAANISVENLSGADKTYLLRGTSNATEQIAFLSDLTGITGGTTFTPRWSVSLVSGVMNLAGDVLAPGNNMVYGTSGTGVRGWYPAGTGGGSGTIGTLTPANTRLATGITYDVAFGRVQGQLDAKGTYSLPAGGSKYQFIDGTGALAPFTTTSLTYKPGTATSGTQFATWAEVWTAFQATTGQVRIFLDDSVAATTIPANGATYDFENRVEFVSGTYRDATLTGASQTASWPTLRNAMRFEQVFVQDLILSSGNTNHKFRFNSGGFQRTYFKEYAFLLVKDGICSFTHRSAAVATFPGVFLETQGRSQVEYTGSSDVATAGIQVLAQASTNFQGLARQLFQDEIQAKFPGTSIELSFEARGVNVQPITGMTLSDLTVQNAIKWLYDNRQTGGAFTPSGSLQISGSTLSLVGDTANPGANKVYGTDGNGVRAWRDAPAGGGAAEGVALLAADQTFTGYNQFSGEVNFYGSNITLGASDRLRLTVNSYQTFNAAYNAVLVFAGDGSAQNGSTDRTYTLPNKSGEVAMLDDVAAAVTAAGAADITERIWIQPGTNDRYRVTLSETSPVGFVFTKIFTLNTPSNLSVTNA